MALDNPNVIDAAGIEMETGSVILTIIDSWDWKDERKHLLALQAKLNAYFGFIESGEIWESYPEAVGRGLTINVVGKNPIPQIGLDLLKIASEACAVLGVKIHSEYYSGS